MNPIYICRNCVWVNGDPMRQKVQLLWSRLQKNRHFRYGVPFIGLLLLSSKVIQNFAQVRYDNKRQRLVTDEELEATGGGKLRRRPAEEVTLEAKYAEYVEKDLIKDYENVRGPRPWEDAAEDEATQEWDQKRRANKVMKPVTKSRESYNI